MRIAARAVDHVIVISIDGFRPAMYRDPAGAGIRPGVPLPLVRQIDLAPTMARLLGFEMPAADGVPLVGLLDRP